MCFGVLSTCLSVHHAWCPWSPEREAELLLGLKLQAIVSHHVGDGAKPMSWESSQCS